MRCLLFLNAIEALQEFGQSLEDRDRAKPNTVIEAGRPGNHLAGWNIVTHGRLRGENYAIAETAMSGNTRLTSENNVVSNDGGPGQTSLGTDQGVLSHFGTVAYLNQIVDLGSIANLGCPDGCPVDTRIGLYIHSITDAHGPRLGNLFPMAGFILRESESISANDRTVFERYVVAEHAPLTHDGVSMSKEVAAGLNTVVEHYMRQKGGMRPKADVLAYNDISPDVGSLADFGGWIDYGCGMDGRRIGRWLIEEAQCAGKSVIGILDSQGGCFDVRKLGFHENGCSPGFARQAAVFGVGHKRDIRRSGVLNPFYTCNFNTCIAAQFRTQPGCQISKFHR